jgi:glycosyltransferase involved in cell wall biosynthesis
MSLPAVSIAIRAYRPQWLECAIASVLSQSFADLELILYDDAGAFEELCASFDDTRMRYHRPSEKRTTSGRFAAALSLCKGEFVGLLDDDDAYEPQFVGRLVESLRQHPKAGAAFCRPIWEIQGVRRLAAMPVRANVQDNAVAQMLLNQGPCAVGPSGLLMRRQALEHSQALLHLPSHGSADVVTPVRMALAGWSHVFVDEPLVVRRWHAAQMSRAGLAGAERAVATLRHLTMPTTDLERLREQLLTQALIRQARFKMLAGDRAGALMDLREAYALNSSIQKSRRLFLMAAAATPVLGPVAVWAAHKLLGATRPALARS